MERISFLRLRLVNCFCTQSYCDSCLSDLIPILCVDIFHGGLLSNLTMSCQCFFSFAFSKPRCFTVTPPNRVTNDFLLSALNGTQPGVVNEEVWAQRIIKTLNKAHKMWSKYKQSSTIYASVNQSMCVFVGWSSCRQWRVWPHVTSRFNTGMLSGTATHFSMHTCYLSLYMFVLQKILFGLNGINSKGAGEMGQIFHEKPQLFGSLKAFLVNKWIQEWERRWQCQRHPPLASV